LGAGLLEGAQHVLGVIHPGQVLDPGRQSQTGGTCTAPDVEHRPAVRSQQL
jgi:hypothetical protein